MSWRASPSTGPGLITPGPCTAWPVWAAWGRAPPSTCSSTSTVGGKTTERPCWPLQVNYCWAQFTIWVNHSPFPCVIRPHGSSSSSHPGLCRLSGSRREPACRLLCGGGAGCGGGVHLGIPRTVGTTPPSTFCIRLIFPAHFVRCWPGGASMRVTAAPRDDLLSCKLIMSPCKCLLFHAAPHCVLTNTFIYLFFFFTDWEALVHTREHQSSGWRTSSPEVPVCPPGGWGEGRRPGDLHLHCPEPARSQISVHKC